jgi:hypothetical protein
VLATRLAVSVVRLKQHLLSFSVPTTAPEVGRMPVRRKGKCKRKRLFVKVKGERVYYTRRECGEALRRTVKGMHMNGMSPAAWKKCLQSWKATSDAAALSVRPHGANVSMKVLQKTRLLGNR